MKFIGLTSLGLGVLAIVNGVNGQKHIKLIPKVSSISKAKYLVPCNISLLKF